MLRCLMCFYGLNNTHNTKAVLASLRELLPVCNFNCRLGIILADFCVNSVAPGVFVRSLQMCNPHGMTYVCLFFVQLIPVYVSRCCFVAARYMAAGTGYGRPPRGIEEGPVRSFGGGR